jgi:hypothetical protein
MRFRAASGRHQNCCTVFATFARLNHSGLITFYAEMGMFDSRSRRILQDSLPHRKSTQVRAVPERGNQGQTQHKGCSCHSLRRPRSSSALAATSGLVNGDEKPSRSSFFYYYTKFDEKPCFALFFSKNPCFAHFLVTCQHAAPFPDDLDEDLRRSRHSFA